MAPKITMVGTLPPIKGVSDYCIEQAKELGKSLEVLFINFKSIYPEFLYKGGGTKENDKVFRFPQTKGVRVENTLAWYNPFSWAYAGFRAQGQILHFHWWTFYLFPVLFTTVAIAKLCGKKIVCTVHNVIGHESGIIDRLLTGTMFLLPDIFIVHTKNNRKQLVEFFKAGEKKVEVIPHGIYSFYRDSNVPVQEARKKLGISQGARTILFFGNIRKYKGLEDLIEAFKSARLKVPGLHLVIAGKPWDREIGDYVKGSLQGIEQKTLSLGYIPSSEIKNYFSAADLVVLPYREFAAQSGPGNIALAFGKPLLVSSVGGLPELVASHDAAFKAGDAGQLSSRIEGIFSKKGVLKGLAADSKALAKKYSWESICRATIGIYNKLAP